MVKVLSHGEWLEGSISCHLQTFIFFCLLEGYKCIDEYEKKPNKQNSLRWMLTKKKLTKCC